MKRNRFTSIIVIASFTAISSACGSEISDALEAAEQLQALQDDLGEDGLTEADIQLALTAALDEDLTDASGNIITLTETEFETLGDQTSSELSAESELTEEVEAVDPSKKYLVKAFLDAAVARAMDDADTDGDDLLDYDEWLAAKFADDVVPSDRRQDAFVAANAYCPLKDDDAETLNSDELRCILRRAIGKRLKEYYQSLPEGTRKEKREERRVARGEKFKTELGLSGELTEEQKETLKGKVKEQKEKREKKRKSLDELKTLKTTDPTNYKKAVEERKTKRTTAKPNIKKPRAAKPKATE